jgi:hypothetical protein
MEERMSGKVTGIAGSPANAGMAFYAAGPIHSVSSRTLGLPPTASPAPIPDTARRSDEADRPFLLWVLASLIAATLVSGGIALSSVVTILP